MIGPNLLTYSHYLKLESERGREREKDNPHMMISNSLSNGNSWLTMRRPHMRAPRSEQTLSAALPAPPHALSFSLSSPIPHSMYIHNLNRESKLGNGRNAAWESGARAQAVSSAAAVADGNVSGEWVIHTLLVLLLNVFVCFFSQWWMPTFKSYDRSAKFVS